MTDIVYAIGDFLQWTFKILETLGNLPNVLFIILGFVGVAFWLFKQNAFTKRDEREGNLV